MNLQHLSRQILERVHSPKQTLKCKFLRYRRECPPSTPPSALWNCPLKTDSTAGQNDWCRENHQVPDDFTKSHLWEHQTIKLRNVRVSDYRKYRLSNFLTWPTKSVSSYTPKIVAKLQTQTRTQGFALADPIYTLGFLTTFKLVCYATRIHKGAAMWSLSQVITTYVFAALNGRTVQCEGLENATSTGNSSRAMLQVPRIWPYSKRGNHFLKVYTHGEAISEASAAIIHFTRSKPMTPLQ